jgi:hypothetical protein
LASIMMINNRMMWERTTRTAQLTRIDGPVYYRPTDGTLVVGTAVEGRMDDRYLRLLTTPHD